MLKANSGAHGVRFLKKLVTEHHYEWRIEMPPSDYEKLAEGELESHEVKERRKSDFDNSVLPKPDRTILSTRLYLDADLVTEIA